MLKMFGKNQLISVSVIAPHERNPVHFLLVRFHILQKCLFIIYSPQIWHNSN